MSESKWKTGEREAYRILKNKGYQFNTVYHDDNSRDSMPDLQYRDGRYLEITHTRHDQGKEKKVEMQIIEDAEGGREKIFLHTEVHTTRNILQELLYDKGPRYSDGQTDLFLFVSREEMESVKYLLNTRKDNPSYERFMEQILAAPFPTLFLCAWDYDRLTYEIKVPVLLRICKGTDDSLSYEFI